MAGKRAKLICVPTNALVGRDDLADASSRDIAGCGEIRSVGAAGPLGTQGKSAAGSRELSGRIMATIVAKQWGLARNRDTNCQQFWQNVTESPEESAWALTATVSTYILCRVPELVTIRATINDNMCHG